MQHVFVKNNGLFGQISFNKVNFNKDRFMRLHIKVRKSFILIILLFKYISFVLIETLELTRTKFTNLMFLEQNRIVLQFLEQPI